MLPDPYHPYPEISVQEFVEKLTLLLKAVNAFIEALKLPKVDNAERLGEKVIQAEEENITPEDFDNYNDYYDAVDKIIVDEEKVNTIGENEKLIKAIEFIVKLADESYPQMKLPLLLEVISKADTLESFVTPEHFTALAKAALDDPELISKVSALIRGDDMQEADYISVIGKLIEIESNIHPEKSIDECKQYVESLG